MKKMRVVFLVVTIVALLSGLILNRPERVDEKRYLKEIAPELVFSEKKGVPPHYRSDRGIIAFNSYDIAPDIRGYAGPIKVLILLTPEGRIYRLKIIHHQETENYVHYMLTSSYLRQFIGKHVNEPFEVDNDIDGISRATVSVKALAETIRVSSRTVASEVLGIEVKRGGTGRVFPLDWLIYLCWFSITFGFYLLTKRNKRFLKYRDLLLIGSILILGVYLSAFFSIIHLYNLLLLQVSSSGLWFVVLLTTVVSMLIAGRFYCGWLCPFGAITEFFHKVPVRKWRISFEVDYRYRWVKYLLLLLFTLSVLIGRKPHYGNYEAYITLFSLHGSSLSWSVVILVFVFSTKVKRFWCRYLCPVGAIGGMLSSSDSRYKGSKDCPMENKPSPPTHECIRCNRCYEHLI
jgi:Na+-translocating ferredoxin:NAD+ oxidoreductase RnfG subunit